MSFYPLLTTLNTVHEGNNISHTIVYVEDTTPTWGAPGVGVSTGGQSYPVTITTDMPDRKSTRLNSSHSQQSRMPSSA